MNTVKVVVENLPKSEFFLEYMPIAIAVIALAVSLYSVYLTRISYIAAHRPYVWSSNYGVIDTEKKYITPIPFRVAYRVRNAPAKILKTEVKINFGAQELLVHVDHNIVRFPDETSEWSFSIAKDQFEEIMDRSDDLKANLSRIISIEYSSFDCGKNYHYKLQQFFCPAENQWKNCSEDAD
ncbi:MAG: hypothetical protein HGA87_02335 [Desulfobulbaceae bacterium]|nr:hypothetical protein [Desulfobulbaceae bacterium]